MPKRGSRRRGAGSLGMFGAALDAMRSAARIAAPAAKARRPTRKKKRKPAVTAGLREAGETLRRLSEAGADFAAQAQGLLQGPATSPFGSQFLTRRHVCEAGARSYRLYVPQNCQLLRPRGLVIMLHGCAQSPEDFALGTRMNALAEEHRLVVAYPAQTKTHQPAACWSWYRPGHQRRGEGEPEIIASIARALQKEFGVARGATFVAGLSAGASMAAILGRTHPEVFAATGLHSGMAPGAARSIPGALQAMKRGGAGAAARRAAGARPVRAILFQGAEDDVVHPSNADHVARAAALGARAGRGAAQVETGRRGGRICTRLRRNGADGGLALEVWLIEGAGHAWSGGNPVGSFVEAAGPDASAEMLRFFFGRKGARPADAEPSRRSRRLRATSSRRAREAAAPPPPARCGEGGEVRGSSPRPHCRASRPPRAASPRHPARGTARGKVGVAAPSVVGCGRGRNGGRAPGRHERRAIINPVGGVFSGRRRRDPGRRRSLLLPPARPNAGPERSGGRPVLRLAGLTLRPPQPAQGSPGTAPGALRRSSIEHGRSGGHEANRIVPDREGREAWRPRVGGDWLSAGPADPRRALNRALRGPRLCARCGGAPPSPRAPPRKWARAPSGPPAARRRRAEPGTGAQGRAIWRAHEEDAYAGAPPLGALRSSDTGACGMLGDNAADLIALAAVAEGRSFMKAAVRRSVPQSALFHAVKGLAMRLGLRLLTCTARSAAPSAEGEDLLATLNPCFEPIEARSQATAASGDAPSGTVRVAATDRAIDVRLRPKPAPFVRGHPMIPLEFMTDCGFADLAAAPGCAAAQRRARG